MHALAQTPYDLLGEEVIRKLAARFYEKMDAEEPALAHLHVLDPDGKVSRDLRERFSLCLIFWLGGPQEYLVKHGHPALRMRHAHVPVDAAMRDAWLRCMKGAMDELEIGGAVRKLLNQRFEQVADFLRNVPE